MRRKNIDRFDPANLTAEDDSIHVWSIRLPLASERERELHGTLSDDEAARVDRYRFREDRARAIASRGLLRECLAAYVNASPRDLAFRLGPYGKPYLAGEASPSFNVSHSGRLLLIAVAGSGDIGIDVECIRSVSDFDAVARRFFSATEREALLRIPAPSRQRAFFRCWTRKEAYVKARALGLSLPLEDFDVSVSGPAVLLATRAGERDAPHIVLSDIETPEGYVGALAHTHPRPLVRQRWFGEGRQLR